MPPPPVRGVAGVGRGANWPSRALAGALALLAVAPPALAGTGGLDPVLRAALNACLTQDLTRTEREAILAGSGWQRLADRDAAVAADAVASALDLPLMAHPNPNPAALTLAQIGDAPTIAERIVHLSFAPDAFAGRTALPQILTPMVRMPD